MGKFLRENWIWIVAPILVVAAIIIVMLVWGGDDASPFLYNI